MAEEVCVKKYRMVPQRSIDFELDPTHKQKEMQFLNALKTIRKLPKWGTVYNQVDFEWPLAKDLLQMPSEKPIRVVSFQFKSSSMGDFGFGAI